MALMILLPPLLLKLGLAPQSGATSLADRPALETALMTLMAQGITQLPIAAYVVWRVAARPDGLRQFGLLPRPRIGAQDDAPPARLVSMGLAGLAIAYPLMNIVMMAGTQIDKHVFHHQPNPVGHDLLEVLLKAAHERDALAVGLLVFSAGIVAPVLEEMIFRGLLQTSVCNMLGWTRRWGIVIGCAVLFAGIHLSAVSWPALPALFVLGLILGWLYERTGSLWPGIVAHAGYNLLSVALLLAGIAGKSDA
jgi:uncharacterized protein